MKISEMTPEKLNELNLKILIIEDDELYYDPKTIILVDKRFSNDQIIKGLNDAKQKLSHWQFSEFLNDLTYPLNK